MANWYQDQITNNNYLSPIGFVFLLDKARNVSFLCQKAEIPTLTLGTVEVSTPGFVDLSSEGQLQYGQLSIDFIVDEDLKNYLEIHNWMRGLGTPEDFDERDDWIRAYKRDGKFADKEEDHRFSDGTLQVLNNNNKLNFNIVFERLFPVSLSTLSFDVTDNDNEYMIAQTTFQYAFYQIRNKENKRRKS